MEIPVASGFRPGESHPAFSRAYGSPRWDFHGPHPPSHEKSATLGLSAGKQAFHTACWQGDQQQHVLTRWLLCSGALSVNLGETL
jgi:hypothetical protein